MTIGLFSFFINLLMLTGPLYMLQVYDRVLSSRSVPTLVALTAVAGGMLLVMGALDLIRSRVLVRIGIRLDAQLKERVFSSIFAQRLRTTAGQRGQALRDLDALRQFLTGQGPFAFFDAPWVPFYLAVVFLFHPILGFVSLAGALLLFTLALLGELLTRNMLRRANAEVTTAHQFAETSLRNAEVIEAMGMLGGIRRRWLGQHANALAFQSKASDHAGTLTASSKAIRMFLQVAILGAGAALAIEQIITPGTMIAASIIMGRALAPVEQAIGNWRQFIAARGSYQRLNALLIENPADAERLKLPSPRGELSVESLVAVPPGGTSPVLKRISFQLAAGEALGVIGPSGAGKSSLARLLVGVWEPASGAVRLDGAEVHGWDREELGPHVGYLPQDVELFDGTVADNIARFEEDPDPENVVRAAEKAGIHEVILRLPEGYDTRIGEGGGMLSGGERQRLGLARALYGHPALVVLDEPNSNLDAAGDQALAKAISDLKSQGQTVVVMAHRPSAIASVDKLLMLNDGAVLAFGPKDEVLANVVQAPTASAAPNVSAMRPQPSPG